MPCKARLANLIQRKRSALWYLAPILFSIIGGLFAYFIVKGDENIVYDPEDTAGIDVVKQNILARDTQRTSCPRQSDTPEPTCFVDDNGEEEEEVEEFRKF